MGKNKKKSSHRNQSNSTSLNTHNKNCVICLEGNKNQEFARLKECNHEFWYYIHSINNHLSIKL